MGHWMNYQSAIPDWGVPTGIEECLSYRRGTSAGGGYQAVPLWVIVMSAMTSAVIQVITMKGQNLHWYSSSENISVTFFPVAYSDSIQWISAATTASVYSVRGWMNCDVVVYCHNLLAVKETWWYIKWSTSIGVNHNFSSSMTFER